MAGRASKESFRTLFEPHRRAITLHCYRMLGSLQDAEEVVQEALLRGWQRQDELRSPGASRAWLYKIATNASLDLLKTRRRRALPHLVALFTTGPANILGLERGTLRPGAVADVTIFDTDFEWTYDVQQSCSKSRNSPFHGRRFRGGPVATIVGGEIKWNRE